MLSSLVATRFGAPLLLVFLIVGMLAGEDGPGGIVFDDYRTTYLVGMIALSVILFDGGLRTRLSSFREVMAPSLLLASVGVLVTAAIVALAVWGVLGFTPAQGMLLGAIVASTDAAAVFFLIRTGGLRLPHRVGATLEVEFEHQRPDLAVPGDPAHRVPAGARRDGSRGSSSSRSCARGCWAPGSASAAGAPPVAMLNRVPMPGGLHPLFVVTGAITIAGFTLVIGGSGLLAA